MSTDCYLFLSFEWRNVDLKKWIIRLLLLVGFSFPYIYFVMHQEVLKDSSLGYLIILPAFILLTVACRLTNNLFVCIVGNVISFIVSYLLISSTGEILNHNFKPFTPIGFLKFGTGVIVFLQLFFLGIAYFDKLSNNEKKHKVS